VRSYITLALPFLIAFFVSGIAWGMWSAKKQRRALAEAAPLRVREHNVPVQLYTYSRPSEFLRQMANSDGRIDVICTSSLLLKSLVQSHWIQKTDYSQLSNLQLISVDFLHLPFDPNSEYSVPLFWNLYGFFGKSAAAPSSAATWKQTWQTKRVTLWGEELNILFAMSRSGVKVQEDLLEEGNKSLENDIHQFAARAAHILQPNPAPIVAEALVANTDWIMLPLGRVARLLGANSPYRFWLPEDGAAVEAGLLAIGSKADQPALAKELINELISTEHALEAHRRLGGGVVHSTLNSMSSIAPLQRAEALRSFPLNRFSFPDLSIEALPRFQKIYDETFASDRAKR
jgi:spermidine/putrescine transport system substrate-binding protein